MKNSETQLFDQFATNYDQALDQGIAVSGESKEFFAAERAKWLAHCLDKLGVQARSVLDFGCGTGSATPFLLEHLRVESVMGVDVSSQALAVARQRHGSDRARFGLTSDLRRDAGHDLAYCNGVFHHIQPADRASAVRSVYQALRPDGYFALWENNPWNPGTRYVMSRIPFDRDAITLSPPETRRLLRSIGFTIIRTDFLFLFPRALRWFRAIEPMFASWPIGAQYQVLAQRPRG